MSKGRRVAVLGSLALGGFGLGLTEFVALGLLPDIAHGVLGDLDRRSHDLALSHAGWIVAAYALGVVIGAPTVAVAAARMPRSRLLLWLLAALCLTTVASAAAPNFALLLLARVAAGVPHGAYFGVAGLLAADAVGRNAQARGFALVLAGLTLANVFGVPLVTVLGQAAGWRVAYLAIAGVFAATLLLAVVVIPRNRVRPDGSPAREIRALASRPVWIAITVTAVGFAGFFSVASYLSSTTTAEAHLPRSAVPWVLVVLGCGMTVGNLLGGWCADRRLRASLAGGLAALAVGMIVFALVCGTAVGLFASAFLVGMVGLFLAPALQAQLVHAAPDAPLLGAALNQSAMNVANSVGAYVGGLAIAYGLGYPATGWLGGALAVVALVGLVAGASVLRRTPRRLVAVDAVS